jgi:hypothetical protein
MVPMMFIELVDTGAAVAVAFIFGQKPIMQVASFTANKVKALKPPKVQLSLPNGKLDADYFETHLGNNLWHNPETKEEWNLEEESAKIQKCVHNKLWITIRKDIESRCCDIRKRNALFKEKIMFMTPEQNAEVKSSISKDRLAIAVAIVALADKYAKISTSDLNFMLGKKERQKLLEDGYEWFSPELKEECEMMISSIPPVKELGK